MPIPRRILPLWFLILLAFRIEIAGFQAKFDTFLDSGGCHGLVVSFTAFTQLAGQVHVLAKFEPVFLLEFNHVKSQLIGNFFHQHFDGKLFLHGAVTAISTRGRGGGVHHIADKA